MDKQTQILLELCKEQADTLRFINKVMFETVKSQRKLSHEEQNSELLDLAWSSNDCIVDNPKHLILLKNLEEEYGIVI